MRSPPPRCPSVGIAREGPRPDPCLCGTLTQGLAHQGPEEPRKVPWVQQRSAGGTELPRLNQRTPALGWPGGTVPGTVRGWSSLAWPRGPPVEPGDLLRPLQFPLHPPGGRPGLGAGQGRGGRQPHTWGGRQVSQVRRMPQFADKKKKRRASPVHPELRALPQALDLKDILPTSPLPL